METTTMVAILQQLIRIQSVNGNEADVARYIAGLFAPYGKRATVETVTYAPGRDNLVVTIGDPQTGPQLGFSGHMDVVAPGELNEWDVAPFAAEIQGDRLYGRGASDMKSGLAALVITMLEMLEQGEPTTGSIRLLATVGEETGEYGAAQLTDAGYADHLAGLVIAEPSGMTKLSYTSRGVIDYYVDSLGKAAHSANPQKGINAIDHLLAFYNEVTALMKTFNKMDPILGGLIHNVDMISGGEQINSVPDHARLAANIRTTPAYPNKVIYEALEGLIDHLNQRPGYQLSITYSYPEEAVPGRVDGPMVKLAQKVGRRVMGRPIMPVGSAGANDGAEFRRAKLPFETIVIGPGSNTSHEVNEFISIKQFLLSVQFYEQFALRFLGEK